MEEYTSIYRINYKCKKPKEQTKYYHSLAMFKENGRGKCLVLRNRVFHLWVIHMDLV